MPIITTSQQTEVIISDAVQAHLDAHLDAYAQLQREIAALETAKASIVSDIEEIRSRAIGQASFTHRGFKVSRVEGTYSAFDKKAFVLLGGDLKLYDAACITKPRKPYTTIRCPGSSDE